jgi:hypothetical protein
VYPAALDLPNMLVVTSADDFAVPADGVNWGRIAVDYLVPAEFVPVVRFDGSRSLASGSSYAVPRVVALAARLLRDEPQLGVTELLARLRNRFADGAAPRQVRLGYLHDPQLDLQHRIDVIAADVWSAPALIDESAVETPLTLLIPLDVLLLDSGWQTAEASAVLDEAQAILARCGFGFDDVRLRRVQAPDYLRDLATGSARTLMDAVRLNGSHRRITIVFARDTHMSIAFDAEAFGRANTRSRPWLTDSVWLTLSLQDRGIALAHELFHILVNAGNHVDTPGNLMLARTTGDNRDLDPEQCDIALRTALEAGLASAAQVRER